MPTAEGTVRILDSFIYGLVVIGAVIVGTLIVIASIIKTFVLGAVAYLQETFLKRRKRLSSP